MAVTGPSPTISKDSTKVSKSSIGRAAAPGDSSSRSPARRTRISTSPPTLVADQSISTCSPRANDSPPLGALISNEGGAVVVVVGRVVVVVVLVVVVVVVVVLVDSGGAVVVVVGGAVVVVVGGAVVVVVGGAVVVVVEHGGTVVVLVVVVDSGGAVVEELVVVVVVVDSGGAVVDVLVVVVVGDEHGGRVVVGGAAAVNQASERSDRPPATTEAIRGPSMPPSGTIQVAAPTDGSTPVATVATAELMDRSAQYNSPWSQDHWSWIRSVHVPRADLPANAERASVGRCRPANGAVPESMAVSASSAKTVSVPEQSAAPSPKSLRHDPTPEASETVVPSGWTSEIWRSAS